MTLRSRVALVRGTYWPVVLALMFAAFVLALTAGIIGIELIFVTGGSAIALTFAWPFILRRVVNRIAAQHQARVEAALADGDDEAYRRLLDETDEYYRACVPRSEQHRSRLRCSALASEERWSEALAVAGAIDRDKVPAAERLNVDNLVAWVSAHAGETARAVELARANADAPTDARIRSYVLGTLGAALVLDGQHAVAVAPLRDAIALGGPRWAQAVRRYYLGEALAALGRLDEARSEWQEAVTIAPKSRWGRRAQLRLDAGAPAAYR